MESKISINTGSSQFSTAYKWLSFTLKILLCHIFIQRVCVVCFSVPSPWWPTFLRLHFATSSFSTITVFVCLFSYMCKATILKAGIYLSRPALPLAWNHPSGINFHFHPPIIKFARAFKTGGWGSFQVHVRTLQICCFLFHSSPVRSFSKMYVIKIVCLHIFQPRFKEMIPSGTYGRALI